MPLEHKHAGFNITGRKLQLVEVVHKENGLFLENVDEEWFDNFGDIFKRESTLVSVLQNAFNKITARKPLICNQISFTLPIEYFKIIRIPFERSLTSKDLNEHLKWELSILYPPISPSDFLVQYIETGKSNLVKNSDLIVIGLKKSIIQTLKKFAEINNLTLRFIDNPHIAGNVFAGSKNKPLVYSTLYYSDNYFSMMMIDSGAPVYFSVSVIDKYNTIPVVFAKHLNSIKEFGINPSLISEYNYCGIDDGAELIAGIQKEFGIKIAAINPFKSFKKEGGSDFTRFHSGNVYAFTPAAGIALRMT